MYHTFFIRSWYVLLLDEMPKDADITSIAEAIKATAFKITRAGELMAREAASRLGYQKGILDLSLAPTPTTFLKISSLDMKTNIKRATIITVIIMVAIDLTLFLQIGRAHV